MRLKLKVYILFSKVSGIDNPKQNQHFLRLAKDDVSLEEMQGHLNLL